MTNEKELMAIARAVMSAMATDAALAKSVAKQMESLRKEKRLITAKEAARLLHISVWTLYRIKNYPDGSPVFSCVKTGKSQSSTLRYNEATLMDEYERYIAWRRG